MKTKVILSQQMASAIIAAGQEGRRKITGLFPGESAYRRAGAS